MPTYCVRNAPLLLDTVVGALRLDFRPGLDTPAIGGLAVETQVGTPESGQISVVSDDTTTRVSIRWPFDRETDEWILLGVKLDNDDIRQAVASHSRTIGREEFLAFEDEGDSVVRMSAHGKNSIGPVRLDCRLSEHDASRVRVHLESV